MDPTSGATVTGLRLAGMLALPALLALLAGCGGHGGGSSLASPSANAQDAAVKFAQCMRQHGIRVEDPKPGAPGIRITSTQDKTKTDAAMQACRKYSPKGKLDLNDPEARDKMLKTAQCLRQHGVDVPDPQPGQGIKIKTRRGDTKVQQAVRACDIPRPGDSSGTHASGG